MDPTENIRREMVAELNSNAQDRAGLEQRYGAVWNTDELTRDFNVVSFFAPFVFVETKVGSVGGTLRFQDMPRFYFDFVPR